MKPLPPRRRRVRWPVPRAALGGMYVSGVEVTVGSRRVGGSTRVLIAIDGILALMHCPLVSITTRQSKQFIVYQYTILSYCLPWQWTDTPLSESVSGVWACAFNTTMNTTPYISIRPSIKKTTVIRCGRCWPRSAGSTFALFVGRFSSPPIRLSSVLFSAGMCGTTI